jgi:hypothetical protein
LESVLVTILSWWAFIFSWLASTICQIPLILTSRHSSVCSIFVVWWSNCLMRS